MIIWSQLEQYFAIGEKRIIIGDLGKLVPTLK